MAAKLVAKHERVVRDIAGELGRRGSVTGREAHQIFRSAFISALCATIPDRERREKWRFTY